MGRFNDQYKLTWIYAKGYTDLGNFDLYMSSCYFIVTTIVTVGYGDITAINSTEKFICCILMITGVIAFSYATGALSSIISNVDSTEAKLKEKINTLNSIQTEYGVSIDLYNQIAKNIRYDHSKKKKDVMEFMNELPHKLRLELAM